MKILSNTSLATKISFPPLVVIVLSLLVTGYNWNGLQEVEHELTSIKQYRLPQAAVTENLAEAVLHSKEIVANYLYRRSEDDIRRMEEQHEIVADNYEQSKTLKFSVEDQEKLTTFLSVYEQYYGLVVVDIRDLTLQSQQLMADIKNAGLVTIVQSLHNIEMATLESTASPSADAQMHIFRAVSALENYYQGHDITDFSMSQLELDAVEESIYYLAKTLNTLSTRRAVEELYIEVDKLRQKSQLIRVSMEKIDTLLDVELVAHSDNLKTASYDLMQKVWDNVEDSTDSSIVLTKNVSTMGAIFTTIALLFGIILSILIIRAISRPIREAVVVANGIADGNLSQAIVTHSNDETGQLLNALHKMQSKIRSQLDEITASAKENQRIKVALDSSTAATLLLDSEHRFIFLNKAMIRTMTEKQADLAQIAGTFDPNKLVGESIELFSNDLERTRTVFNNLKTICHHTLEFGATTYSVSSAPVIDDDGVRTGSVVQWDDITEQLQMEAEVKNMIGEAKSGNLNLRINIADKSGFYQTLSEEINALVSENESVITESVNTLGAIARGDLTRKITTDYQGSYALLKNNINSTIDKLITVISSIKRTSFAVDEGARGISQGNTDLSQRTQVQSTELDRSARSIVQISGNVNEAAGNAVHANELAIEASEKAKSGGSILASANDAMAEINRASLSIRDIISVMDEIAFQTNLLALNASVEAAHAGNLGRGFAVVADEVRSLAQRSADAAKEVKDLINDTVDKVDDGTKLVVQSSQSLDEIIISVTQVSEIINQISETSSVQSTEIKAVSNSIEQLDGSNQENSLLVDKTATASESLRNQAEELTGLIGFFSINHDLEITEEQIQATLDADNDDEQHMPYAANQ